MSSGNSYLHGVDDTNTRTGGGVKWIPVKVDSNGNLKIAPGVSLAGDRNPASSTTDYKRAFPTGTATRKDGLNAAEAVITASPAVLHRVITNAAHDGNITIRNAATTGGGSTPLFVLDLATGQSEDIYVEFSSGITVDGDNAASDFTVVWSAL